MKLKKQDILFFVITIALIIFDQATKYLIRIFFVPNKSITLIPNFLSLTYVQNTGIAFGFLQNTTSILVWLSVVVLGILLFLYDKIPLIPRFLIAAGIIGNLIDRIFLKFVVDFINFKIWPAFNIADSCLTIGVILLILHIIKNKESFLQT